MHRTWESPELHRLQRGRVGLHTCHPAGDLPQLVAQQSPKQQGADLRVPRDPLQPLKPAHRIDVPLSVLLDPPRVDHLSQLVVPVNGLPACIEPRPLHPQRRLDGIEALMLLGLRSVIIKFNQEGESPVPVGRRIGVTGTCLVWLLHGLQAAQDEAQGLLPVLLLVIPRGSREYPAAQGFYNVAAGLITWRLAPEECEPLVV